MIYRGDFTIHWTGECSLDGLYQKYGPGEWNNTFVGRATDSWLALQFAKSLGEHAEISLCGVTLLVLGRKKLSDYHRLEVMEKVITAKFDNPVERNKPIEHRHRKGAR